MLLKASHCWPVQPAAATIVLPSRALAAACPADGAPAFPPAAPPFPPPLVVAGVEAATCPGRTGVREGNCTFPFLIPKACKSVTGPFRQPDSDQFACGT